MGELNVYRQLGIKPNFTQIGRRYGLHRQTVAKYWRRGEEVEDRRRDKESAFDEFGDVIESKAAMPGVTKKAIQPASGGCAPAICAAPTWRSCGARRASAPAGRGTTRKYAAFQVLVLDEWLLDRPDELFRGFLLELMGARYGTASTVFCTQFRQKGWHARLGGGVHADAIMDRIVHGAAWVGMGEMNMRKELGAGSE